MTQLASTTVTYNRYPEHVYLAHSRARSRPLLRAAQTRTQAATQHKHARTQRARSLSPPSLPPSPALSRRPTQMLEQCHKRNIKE